MPGASGWSRYWRWWIGVGVLLAVACAVSVAGAAARNSREQHVLVAKRSTLPHGVTLSTSQVISALAAEGVGVYRSPSDTTPVKPVSAPAVPIEVLYPQAVLYAAETKHHSGTLGASLNQVMPMPAAPAGQAYPKADYLMAAYASLSATPGEVLAGKLLGRVDLTHPDTVVFPDLIETLLGADALRVAEQGSSAAQADFALAGSRPPVASAAGVGSLCSTLADWISHAYNAVFNALTVGPSSNSALNFIGGLWNQAVSLAQSAISNVASALTGPVIAAIRVGLATAGVVSWAVSTLRNLQVTISADPSYNSFGIEPDNGKTGKVTITVGKPGGWDWPSGIPQCAQALGVTLPSVNSVVGRNVQWKMIDVNSVPTDSWCEPGHACYLAKQESAESSLHSDHTASLSYRTNTETHFQETHGIPINTDSILVSGTVSLNTDQLVKLIRDVLLDAVPGGAAKVVTGPLFDTLTSALQGQLAKLSQPKFFRYVLIEHHGNATLPSKVCDDLDLTVNPDDFPAPPTSGPYAPDAVTVRGVDASTPGLEEGTACDVTTYVPGPGDGYQCSATVNCQPLGFWDLLDYTSGEDATKAYNEIVENGEFANSTPIGGIGDQAAVTTGGGIVRVENDVFLFRWEPQWSNDPQPNKVLEDAVEQICPDCTANG